MEVTLSGVTGGIAANHVEEEFSNGFVLAPTPRQQTKEGIAENSMDQLEKHANVTHKRVQVCFINLNLEESKTTPRFQ